MPEKARRTAPVEYASTRKEGKDGQVCVPLRHGLNVERGPLTLTAAPQTGVAALLRVETCAWAVINHLRRAKNDNAAPSPLADLPRARVIRAGTLKNYKAASEIAGSRMPLYSGGPAERGGDGGEGELLHFVTVNGHYQPVLRARPGEALRLRVVHGGNNDHLRVSLVPAAVAAVLQRSVNREPGRQEEEEATGTGGAGDAPPAASSADDGNSCNLLTLARDGVYLPAPRLQGGGDGRVLLSPGSRADLAVRCDRPGVYRLVSSKGGAVGGGERGEEDDENEESIMAYLGKKTGVFEGEFGEGFVDPAPVDCPLNIVFREGVRPRCLQSWWRVRILYFLQAPFGGGAYICFLPFASVCHRSATLLQRVVRLSHLNLSYCFEAHQRRRKYLFRCCEERAYRRVKIASRELRRH